MMENSKWENSMDSEHMSIRMDKNFQEIFVMGL